MLEVFKLIENNNIKIAFHIPSSTIIRLPCNSFHILKKIKEGSSINEVASNENIDNREITRFIDKLIDSVSTKEKVRTPKSLYDIDRITLHVSNDCNLRCTYCYADFGTYQNPKELMSEEKANEIFYFFIKHRITFRTVVFFGGEPLLNLKVIRRVCSYLESQFETQKISYMPRFVIITNGTIISQEIIDLVKQYNISITVSIDGPEDINDLHRAYSNGKGSFSKIKFFIDQIKNQTNSNISFEATFTDKHITYGYSENDIYKFMKEVFGLSGKVVPEMSVQNSPNLSEGITDADSNFFNRVDNLFFGKNNTYSDFDPITLSTINALANKTAKNLCQIGSRMIGISVNGDISPCHLSTNIKQLTLGNISSENIFTNPDSYLKKHPFLSIISKKEEPCRSCWVKNLCSGCSHQAYQENIGEGFSNQPSEEFCFKQKYFIEKVVTNIALLQSTPKEWESFMEKLRKRDNLISKCIA